MILSLHPGFTFIELSINIYAMWVTIIIPRNIATDINTMETVVGGSACFGSITSFFGAFNKKLIFSPP